MPWQTRVLQGVRAVSGSWYQPPVLVYHSFTAGRPGAITQGVFRRHLEKFAAWGIDVVPLAEAFAYAHRGAVAAHTPVALTFDDGYADFIEEAYPLLRAAQLPSAVCVIATQVGMPGFLGWDQLRMLTNEGRVTLVSHTMTHHDLAKMDDNRLDFELRESKRILEEGSGSRVECISYPWGQFSARVVAAARAAGYTCGLTTNAKLARGECVDPRFALRRMTVNESDLLPHFFMKVSGIGSCFARTMPCKERTAHG